MDGLGIGAELQTGSTRRREPLSRLSTFLFLPALSIGAFIIRSHHLQDCISGRHDGGPGRPLLS